MQGRKPGSVVVQPLNGQISEQEQPKNSENKPGPFVEGQSRDQRSTVVEPDAYWIPPSPIEEARLIQILAEMVKVYLTLEENNKNAEEMQSKNGASKEELLSE